MSGHVRVMGRLTRDPEMSIDARGVVRAVFTVASNDRVKDDTTGEWRDSEHGPTFWRVTAWRYLGQQVTDARLVKGEEVAVEGRARLREWTGTDGNTRRDLDIDADMVAVLVRTVADRQRGDGRRGGGDVPGGGGVVRMRAGEVPEGDPWVRPAGDVPAF